MQKVVADIEALGASIVIISPQLEKFTQQTAKKFNLKASVLSDPGNKVAALFGLAFRLPENLKALYRGFGADLNRFNGDDTGTLPMPGRFVIDGRGVIVHADVHPDYTTRPEPADLPEIIESVVSLA